MITDRMKIARVLNNCLIDLYEEGIIQPDSNGDLKPEQVYPFRPDEIEGVHTHQIGHGDGVFIRLKNGRVFNKYGEEEEADLALYDTVEN